MRDLERVGRVPDELPRSRGPSCVVVPRPLQGGGTFAAASISRRPPRARADARTRRDAPGRAAGVQAEALRHRVHLHSLDWRGDYALAIYIDQCDRDGIHPLSCHSQQYEIAQIVFEVAMQVGCMLLVDHSRFIAGASFCLVPAIMLGATGFYSDRFSSRQHSSSGCRVAMSHPSDCSLRQGARPLKTTYKGEFVCIL